MIVVVLCGVIKGKVVFVSFWFGSCNRIYDISDFGRVCLIFSKRADFIMK